MSEPKLRVAASGFGGSGYKNPFTGEKIPGVTTVLNAIDKPGVLQWSIDQVSAYAALNAESLLERTPEQGYKFLRFYHKRLSEADFDDPMVNLRNSANGVLNDLAELGTMTHEWIEADLNDWLEPELVRQEQVEMVEQYLIWRSENAVEVYETEATVFGDGYGGTADLFAKVNGKNLLVDVKTSRMTRREHFAQLAALGAAHSLAREVPEGSPDAKEYTATKKGVKSTSYWVEDVLPPVEGYAVLHLRPNDWDDQGNLIPAFCELKEIPQPVIDEAYNLFRGALSVTLSGYAMKRLEKEHGLAV